MHLKFAYFPPCAPRLAQDLKFAYQFMRSVGNMQISNASIKAWIIRLDSIVSTTTFNNRNFNALFNCIATLRSNNNESIDDLLLAAGRRRGCYRLHWPRRCLHPKGQRHSQRQGARRLSALNLAAKERRLLEE